ncbi:cellulase family glycosylhydrolase [Bacillus sp. CLL-7-23]|uniref:Cellulase family glycosylhydrolase n=1 Tax=Bacillus changyiensis TaxID=3004103 RepID=A0ABT4X0Z5_9BACI|nr:cellulase family glycosylhydrolase [Bacillus changyiensis]MDA7025825.1 cellulase family glycosylhydrolase [Bacillus changyiensis]
MREKHFAKCLKVFLIFFIITLVAIPTKASGTNPTELLENMSPGWNLGNTLDANPTEGSWNNPPVREHTFDDIRDAGFKSVRIPVTWNSHIGKAHTKLIQHG